MWRLIFALSQIVSIQLVFHVLEIRLSLRLLVSSLASKVWPGCSSGNDLSTSLFSLYYTFENMFYTAFAQGLNCNLLHSSIFHILQPLLVFLQIKENISNKKLWKPIIRPKNICKKMYLVLLMTYKELANLLSLFTFLTGIYSNQVLITATQGTDLQEKTGKRIKRKKKKRI